MPSEEEEQQRHLPRQREALVRLRTRLQAQGRGLLVSHSQPAPPHWWRTQTWNRLNKVLPAWLLERLEVFRPILTALDTQIAALSHELEAAAPPELPRGLGKLTSVALSREVCDWRRFHNRRQVASYTGLCPGEHSSGNKRVQGKCDQAWEPAAARLARRAGVAIGPLPAELSAGAGAARVAHQRRAGHRRATQEGHRGGGQAFGGGSLALAHRPMLGAATRFDQLTKANFSPIAHAL